ncbi:MAG TPA: protein kinase [Terriglobales bacterium]|nr:protein kinase [Terriglobales bacterium]
MKSCTACRATYPNDYSHCPRDGTPLVEAGAWSEGAIIRGKYRILSKVGQGGMGAVYKAHHVLFGELRALKVINPGLLSDELFVKRFKQEAVIARKLDHPNAVRVDDIDESEDGRPFMVMEFIEGESLKNRIQARGPLPVPAVCSIVKQVVSALDAAHHLGMIHRDIKPANIVLVQTPKGEQAKVLDFGIAKFREAHLAETGEMTLTGTGVVIGTPQYMSPEQAMGRRSGELDGRSDLYSLGVVMYQMLTGELPFKADTTMELLMAHINAPPRPILEARPDLPISPAIAGIVMKCLEKKPELRPATGAALIEELDRVLNDGAKGRDAASPATEAAPAEVGATQVLGAGSMPTVRLPAARPAPQTQALPSEASTAPTTAAAPATAPVPQAASSKGLRWAVALLVVALAAVGGFAVWHYKVHHSTTTTVASTNSASSVNPANPVSSPGSTAQPPTQSPAASPPSTGPGTTSGKPVERASAETPGAAKTPRKTEAQSPPASAPKTQKAETQKLFARSSPPPASPQPTQSVQTTSTASVPAPVQTSGPSGDLVLTSSPGAILYIDGKEAGAINSSGQLVVRNVAAGTHQLRLGYPGFPGYQYSINVSPGGTAFVTAKAEGSEGLHPSVIATPNSLGSAAAAGASAPTAAQTASFSVTHLHRLGSCQGTLVVTKNAIAYHASNSKDSFQSALQGINWGTDLHGDFYVRLRNGKVYTFRSQSPSTIVATINRNTGVTQPHLAGP